MIPRYEVRRRSPMLVFDLVDSFARMRYVRGPHPRPIGRLRFSLIQRLEAGNPVPLAKPIDMIMSQSSGYFVFGGLTLGDDGSNRRVVLPNGRYVVRIESEFYQDATPQVYLPAENLRNPARVDLKVGHTYPFTDVWPFRPQPDVPFDCTAAKIRPGNGPTLLRGVLYERDGKGLAGATVRVENEADEVKVYRTDATGQWVLWFEEDQATGPVNLSFGLPGGPVTVADVCIVRGCEMSLGQTGIRGAVFDREGMPALGATITVAGDPNGLPVDADGRWAYYYPLNLPQFGAAEDAIQTNVTATLPSGATETITAEVRRRATTVAPAIRFT